MEPTKNNSNIQNSQKIFCKQPISCPWITSQPYQSSLNKNRACESSVNKSLPNIPLSMESRTINEKTCPSLQHSSSQFFYFLRLMQLFPEIHPATLHTVLCLCKNDFFCAVDKLLYAKRCKSLYSRSQNMFKRCSASKSHPYCGHSGTAKFVGQPENFRNNNMENNNSNMNISAVSQKCTEDTRVQIVAENILDVRIAKENSGNSSNISLENESSLQPSVSPTPTIPQSQSLQEKVEYLSPGNTIETEELKVDKTNEV